MHYLNNSKFNLKGKVVCSVRKYRFVLIKPLGGLDLGTNIPGLKSFLHFLLSVCC